MPKLAGPALVLALTIAAYWPSFKAPFIFDDQITIEGNQAVRSGEALLPASLFDRQILRSTYAWNWYFGGASTVGYHAVNLVLHLANAALVYAILMKLGFPLSASLIGMIIFALHPLQTESVAYISGRSELLAGMIVLAGICVFQYTIWISPRVTLAGMASLIVIGYGVKESVVALPFLLAALVAPYVRFTRRAMVLGSALLLLGGLAVAFTLRDATLSPEVGRYYWLQGVVFWRHVGQLFWPVLSIDWQVNAGQIVALIAWIAALTLAGAAWAVRHSRPALFFGVAALLTLIAPRSLFPVPDVMVEHRMYVPMLGVAVLCAELALVLVREGQKSLKTKKRPDITEGAFPAFPMLKTYNPTCTTSFESSPTIFSRSDAVQNKRRPEGPSLNPGDEQVVDESAPKRTSCIPGCVLVLLRTALISPYMESSMGKANARVFRRSSYRR